MDTIATQQLSWLLCTFPDKIKYASFTPPYAYDPDSLAQQRKKIARQEIEIIEPWKRFCKQFSFAPNTSEKILFDYLHSPYIQDTISLIGETVKNPSLYGKERKTFIHQVEMMNPEAGFLYRENRYYRSKLARIASLIISLPEDLGDNYRLHEKAAALLNKIGDPHTRNGCYYRDTTYAELNEAVQMADALHDDFISHVIACY